MSENNSKIPSDCASNCNTCGRKCAGKLWFRMKETDEYERIVRFFMENGLEYNEEDYTGEPDTAVVKMFKIYNGNDNLAAAVCIALREGKYIIDGIAVDEMYRGKNLGRILLDKTVKVVKELGGNEIYLVARAPGFFAKYGFEVIKPEDAPNFFECKYCSQYQKSCNPEVMKYTIS